ncbi:Hypothetical predicted protein, partial [Paramuricea clavata]
MECAILQNTSCRSANYNKTATSGKKKNCELLQIVDSEEYAKSLKRNKNFDHYIILSLKKETQHAVPSSTSLPVTHKISTTQVVTITDTENSTTQATIQPAAKSKMEKTEGSTTKLTGKSTLEKTDSLTPEPTTITSTSKNTDNSTTQSATKSRPKKTDGLTSQATRTSSLKMAGNSTTQPTTTSKLKTTAGLTTQPTTISKLKKTAGLTTQPTTTSKLKKTAGLTTQPTTTLKLKKTAGLTIQPGTTSKLKETRGLTTEPATISTPKKTDGLTTQPTTTSTPKTTDYSTITSTSKMKTDDSTTQPTTTSTPRKTDSSIMSTTQPTDKSTQRKTDVTTTQAITTTAVPNITVAPSTQPTNCKKILRLGMENGEILGAQITASSTWANDYHGTDNARLNLQRPGDIHAWVPSTSSGSWLQVDFELQATISEVLTQGRGDYPWWVKSYNLSYSSDGVYFHRYRQTGVVKSLVFPGNSDKNTIVHQDISPVIVARYIRILPQTWHKHVALRVDFSGCLKEHSMLQLTYIYRRVLVLPKCKHGSTKVPNCFRNSVEYKDIRGEAEFSAFNRITIFKSHVADYFSILARDNALFNEWSLIMNCDFKRR